MYLRGDSILAADNGVFRLHLFGPDLHFVETRSFAVSDSFSRPFMRGVFSDGSWLALAYEGGGRLSGAPGTLLRSRYSLVHYDARGQLLNEVVKLDSRPRLVHQFGNSIHYPYIPLTADPLDAVSGDEVYVLRGPRAELEVYDAAGHLTRLVRWSRPLVRSSDVWPRYKERDLAAMSGQNRDSYAHFYSLDLPIPEFVPQYDAMRVDDARRVWLRRYSTSDDREPPTWDILDHDGAWLGSAQTPRGFSLYRAGDGYLLGRRVDSLGVERIQLLRTHTTP